MITDKDIRDIFGKPTIDFHWMEDSETGRIAFLYHKERLAMIDKNGRILDIASDSKRWHIPSIEEMEYINLVRKCFYNPSPAIFNESKGWNFE